MNRFTTGLLTGLTIGVGLTVLAPSLARWGRPAAKATVRGALIAYQRGREAAAELGERAEDLVAEVSAQLETEEAERPANQATASVATH